MNLGAVKLFQSEHALAERMDRNLKGLKILRRPDSLGLRKQCFVFMGPCSVKARPPAYSDHLRAMPALQ